MFGRGFDSLRLHQFVSKGSGAPGSDEKGIGLAGRSSFHFPSPPRLHPSGSPLRVRFAPLHQDAPLLDLGPKGRCPLGLSPRDTHVAALVPINL